MIVVAGTGAGCAGTSTSAPVSITVFGAASLRDALEAAAAAYESETGIAVIVSTDSSTTLRTQIELGAEVDVFLSADTQNPEALAAAGLVDGAVRPFAGNGLAVALPADNPAGLSSPFDLARPGVRIIAAAAAVPITGYASTLVDNLAGLPDAPAGFAAAYAANVVSREDNVAAVLAKLELGEGDVGIVYASDARGSRSVTTIETPIRARVAAVYEGAVPATATRPLEGHAFLDWIAGPEGQAILADHGFVPPP